MKHLRYALTGLFILSTTGLVFSVGYLIGQITAPEPCIENMHSMSYPVFWHEQEMLEGEWEYPKGSLWNEDGDGYKNSIELAYALVEMSKDSPWPSEIYTNPRTGKMYYIPGLCTYEVNGLGDPVLYRK